MEYIIIKLFIFYLGTPILKILKLVLGVGLLLIIFGLIYGPLLLFSDLNPISKPNKIQAVTIKLDLSLYNNKY